MDIPTAHLGPFDVLVAHVGCGNLPVTTATKLAETVKANLKTVFGDEQPLLVMMVPEARHTEFSIISRTSKPAERKVAHVDVGDMSPAQAERYLERIRSEMRK